jgi:hypothetical protein
MPTGEAANVDGQGKTIFDLPFLCASAALR